MAPHSKLIPKPSPRAAYRVIDGEAVIITIADSRQHTLNGTGTFIWSLLEEGAHSVGQIASLLQEEFCVGTDEAGEDVERFINELSARGMIVLESPRTDDG